ncbi:MAG: hypothetical protein GX616_16855 [Planctomycetes bacterium]|nr:hypothetical protein [Planctomycetota bacterium]
MCQLRCRRVGLAAAWALIVSAASQASAGTIDGRREDAFGNDIHESFIWFTGIGNNAANAWAIGFSWCGNFTIDNVPAGQYYFAANEYGQFPHYIGGLVTVPASGTVSLTIRDRATVNSNGLTDVGECLWAAQEFVATGTSVERVLILSPNEGSQVSVSIRENDPWGARIGPAVTKTLGALYPAFVEWALDEVPVIPGRRYAVRFDRVGTSVWRPCVSYRINEYPNGGAWFDGVYRSEADLRVAVTCRDNGFAKDYSVSNWWRSVFFSELVQTFVPQGDRMRVAQMMLAGQEARLMRASIHQWTGAYPPGAQVGPTKTAQMHASLKQGFVWGPEEVPLTPGQAYAIRFVRVDGQPFAIYGDADNYSLGQAYFDGVADNGIDITGNLVTRQRDLGEMVLSNLVITPLSATEVRVTFDTDVPTTATVVYRTGSPVFDSIVPADETIRSSHEVIVRHLHPATSYQMSILAHNPTRNVLRSGWSTVVTPAQTATLAGEVYSQIGRVSGAFVFLDELGQVTTTNSLGEFTFTNVPTGRHTLRIENVACESASCEVDVAPDGSAGTQVELVGCHNLLSGTDDNPIAGWTEFGTFDGQWNSGDWSIYARTGPKWVGSITSGPGGKKGGIYRTIATQPGKSYLFGGWVLTKAWGSAAYDPIPGLALARIGVDPTGGTDPASSSVIWGRYRFTDGRWWELTVPFTASGTQATLLCQHKYEEFYLLAPWWLAAFDDLWVGTRLPSIPDFDRDGDVDQEDFGLFQACYTSPGVAQEDPDCAKAMLDGDDDVDPADFAIFLNCMAGPGVAYAIDCAD